MGINHINILKNDEEYEPVFDGLTEGRPMTRACPNIHNVHRAHAWGERAMFYYCEGIWPDQVE